MISYNMQVLNKKKQNTRSVYIKIHAPPPPLPLHLSALKVTANSNLTCKNIFSLKQKPNKILSTAIEKIKFYLFKKTASCYFRL